MLKTEGLPDHLGSQKTQRLSSWTLLVKGSIQGLVLKAHSASLDLPLSLSWWPSLLPVLLLGLPFFPPQPWLSQEILGEELLTPHMQSCVSGQLLYMR